MALDSLHLSIDVSDGRKVLCSLLDFLLNKPAVHQDGVFASHGGTQNE
jgi:hypothetical protein